MTLPQLTQVLILSLEASLLHMRIHTRNISQANVRSHTLIEHHVYIRPSDELKLLPNSVLRVAKPLYGNLDSSPHWYLTYFGLHVDTSTYCAPEFLRVYCTNENLRTYVQCGYEKCTKASSLEARSFQRWKRKSVQRSLPKPGARPGNVPITSNGATLSEIIDG